MFRAAFKSPSLLHRPLSTTQHLRRPLNTFANFRRRRLIQPNEAVRSHTVRFLPPPFTARQLVSFVLYTTCLTGYVWYFFPAVEVEVQIVDDTDRGDDDQHHHDEFADEDSFFIPLTWSKKLPRSFYKGSDPEWQEFVKISKDKPRHKKIQSELVKIVFDTVQKHPAFIKQLGRDTTVGQCWLDIVFPEGPPQEYVRGGIEIGSDYMAYTLQRIDAQHQHRITRTLFPTAAFNGFYASAKIILGFQYHRLKQLLGWEIDPTPGSNDARYRQLLLMLEAQRVAKTQAGLAATGDPGTAVDKAQDNTASLFPWAAKIPSPPSSVEMPIAQHVFKASLAQGRLPKNMEPPRGSFVVQGLIQLKGSRSILTLDVKAFYDPKASQFVVVNATHRSIKQRKQSPKGGN